MPNPLYHPFENVEIKRTKTESVNGQRNISKSTRRARVTLVLISFSLSSNYGNDPYCANIVHKSKTAYRKGITFPGKLCSFDIQVSL